MRRAKAGCRETERPAAMTIQELFRAMHFVEGVMSNQVNRRDMERWLRDHGFTLAPGKKTGHVFYVREGVKITLPGHGPQDLTKKLVALILRQLEMSGFDKEQIRRELDA